MTAITDDLLTTEEVAEWIRVSPMTIRDWRKKGRGPRALKIGHAVRYPRREVAAWIAQVNAQPV